jgi:hypothetical protein
MVQKIFFITALLLQIVLFSKEPTLRALIMCDTISEDIKKASFVDLENMRQTASLIAENLHMKKKITVLQGKRLRTSVFKHWIGSLPSSSEDIVLFYYSGHGFHGHRTKTPWPSFFLKTSKKKKAVTGQSVYKILKKHKPRLAIILFDCCNVDMYEKSPVTGTPPSFFTDLPPLPGLQTLFAKTRGVITITAASPGEYSLAIVGGRTLGSLFTNQFVSSLLQTCRTENISWNDVLKETKTLCLELSDDTQTALGLLEVK